MVIDSTKENAGRWVPVVRHFISFLKQIPFTLVMSAIILVIGIIIQTIARNVWPSLMQMFGWDLPILKEGKLYAPWVGLLFGSRPGHWQTIFGMGIVGIGALEYRHGLKWAFFGFLLLGPLVSIIAMLLMWPLGAAGLSWVNSYLYEPDMGASAASLVCWGLFVGAERSRWRGLLLWGTILVIIISWIIMPAAWQVDHSLAFILGITVSAIWLRQKEPSGISSRTQKSVIEKVRK